MLSEKSNNSNEKCSETISNYRVIDDQDGFVAESLFHEFSDLLSNTGKSSKINLIGDKNYDDKILSPLRETW